MSPVVELNACLEEPVVSFFPTTTVDGGRRNWKLNPGSVTPLSLRLMIIPGADEGPQP